MDLGDWLLSLLSLSRLFGNAFVFQGTIGKFFMPHILLHPDLYHSLASSSIRLDLSKYRQSRFRKLEQWFHRRYFSGNFISCFTKHIGILDVLQTELLDIFQGLKLAWSCGNKHIVLQSDNAEAIGLLSLPSPSCPHLLVSSHEYGLLISMRFSSWGQHDD
ncbi:hypothetical protein V6N13_029925 [Hibiscus sabdariffa]|uniref:RNase H type-1 domain-containing protein n=1 Tax=Hibiscus sabdariffa TaxID=183260 RepID=A0ABR2T8X1_9ROSI